MNTITQKLLLFICATTLIISCSTPKEVVYFEDLQGVTEPQKISDLTSRELLLEPDDELYITVSALNPASVAPFNLPLVTFKGTTQKDLSTTPSVQTYRIDPKGEINFPVLGKIQAAGKTQTEVAKTLETEISKYVDNPIVTVYLAGARVAVLGEVNHPGNIYFSDNKYSIIDAIGHAGDLTIHGRRDNILLIREEDGTRKTIRLDLTDSNIFNSPYFYLKQHDVIYVEPNEAKSRNSTYSQASQYSISVISTIVSVTSVIVSLVIALTK